MTARQLVFLGVGAFLCLSACNSVPESTGARPPRFVYISPDPLGINPFLIMGQTGIEQAAAQHGAEARVLESEDPTTREENFRAAVDEGASLVVVIGFEFEDVITELAPRNPDVQFLIVDQCIQAPPPNVTCAVFREFDAAFIIGAIAAELSVSGHIGVVGTADIPFLHRYTDAYQAGAHHVKPDLEVSIRWVGGENPFADPVRAKEQALDLAARGADHIFAASAAGNLGIFQAAEEQGFFAFGLDVDQCPNAPGHIVDNLIKRVDHVIVQAIEAIQRGDSGHTLVFGLDTGELTLEALQDEPPADSQCTIGQHPEVIQKARELSRQLIAGEIGIQDPMGLF